MSEPLATRSPKDEIRHRTLASRRALPPGERRERSRRITASLAALPAFRDSGLVCVYVSHRDEVETGELIQTLLAAGRALVAPAHLHGTDRALVFARFDSWSDLHPSHFGILQPSRAEERRFPTRDIPLFLVPGIAFDLAGQRLGSGLGFYDRALAGAAPGALLIGLAFELQIFERLPADPHDVPMDLVVTEDRLIQPPSRDGAPVKEVVHPWKT